MDSETSDTSAFDDADTAVDTTNKAVDDLPEVTGSLGATRTERALYAIAPWTYPL